jgi:hypothetical protein
MQSPAPVSKKISGRSGDSASESKSSSVASDFERILNIEAVTTEEERKEDTDDQEVDSTASTVTEEKNPAPAVGGSQASQGSSDSEDDGSSTSESDSDSDSDSESDISSKSSSDSTSNSIDSDLSIATTKMSSTLKSPICNGDREGFEEWHSQWEVYAGDNKFDEYISEVIHPDLPVDGHANPSPSKEEKKALKYNKKAIASLRISFATTYSVDAMIEASIDDSLPTVKWPYGRIDLVLIDLYETY